MIIDPRRSEPGLFVELALDGKIVVPRRRAESWVQAATRIWYRQMSQVGGADLRDVTNTLRNPATTNNYFYMVVGADSSATGIVVGSGNTGVATSDYKLQTQIATGNGAGQLRYMAQTYNGPFQTSEVNYYQAIRNFINNSGAGIDVWELGMYVDCAGFVFCIVRDVLGAVLTVPATETLTVTYTIETGL